MMKRISALIIAAVLLLVMFRAAGFLVDVLILACILAGALFLFLKPRK